MPAAFVGEVVVPGAQRYQVVEVASAAVLPPDDVVRLGVVEADGAARHGAARVEGAQGPTLGPVGEAGGPPEVQFARGVKDHAVAHDDGLGVGSTLEQLPQDAPRQLDRDTPFDVWWERLTGVGTPRQWRRSTRILIAPVRPER